jgi:stalled ribosome alternative rescue factor ArfA
VTSQNRVHINHWLVDSSKREEDSEARKNSRGVVKDGKVMVDVRDTLFRRVRGEKASFF